jgi:hypothetical protein
MTDINIDIGIDRKVRRDFPEVTEELVRQQLSTSGLHNIVEEHTRGDNQKIKPEVVVVPGNGHPIAKFRANGKPLLNTPGFYVLRSQSEYKATQPGRLLQEIACGRNWIRDYIVKNMQPSAQGIPNLEIFAEILNLSNVQTEAMLPTADADVRLSVHPVGDEVYAPEREVFGRLFNLGTLPQGEILKRYTEIIKMGIMLRVPDDVEEGRALADIDNELSPIALHYFSVRDMIQNTPNRTLDVRTHDAQKRCFLMGIWDKLMSKDHYSKNTVDKVNTYILKMLYDDPNSFISDPIHLEGVLIQPNSDDNGQYSVD